MSAATAVAGALQVLGATLLAPLVLGAVASLKARLQGRLGPSPLQPYRELRRLWGKSGVDPSPRTALYRLAPAAVAASLAVAALLIPVAGEAPEWGVGHDAVALVVVLGLGRFCLAVAAWDTGGGFGLMGAARDLTFAAFAEALFLLVVVLAALPSGPSTDLVAISAAAAGSDIWGEPAHWCAALAFALFVLAEAGRQPVDNPDTHLELTMVHEGPLLEYAGRDLAVLQWGAAVRLWLLLLLGAELFGPTGGSFGARLAIEAATIATLCGAVAVTETALAKMRILRVPLFLAGGMALCLAGLGSWLAGGGL